ncbi:MAG TPA: response regulator [Dissulfurispiraceae bacterium]|nr:response regulator [Dissulfurispiraceae bacterium]
MSDSANALKVLVIEDNPADALLIEETLIDNESAVVVRKADRLSTGLKAIDEDRFDVVLLDLGLPDTSGLDSLQTIQAREPDLPVIILTGNGDKETADEAIAIGAQDYLVKSEVDRKLLSRCIHYAITRKKSAVAFERSYSELEYELRKRDAEMSVFDIELKAEIEEKKLAEDELIKSHTQLRDLARNLQSLREEERTLIAREIHDELGQILSALKMDLVWIKNRLNGNQPIMDKLQSDVDLIDRTIGSVKRIITELRPALLDSLGLEAALEWQCEEFQKRTGIKCNIVVTLKVPVTEPEMKTALFRIFQEVLTNVLRHAHASKVDAVLMNYDGATVLRVRDNGVGMNEEEMSKANSFGLLGMRERVYPWGGRIEIKSKKYVGTTITAVVPISLPVK